MKQFNLQEFLENPECKVVARDGRSVRIICTDVKSGADKPIVALAYDRQEECENIFTYYPDGTIFPNIKSDFDLFFAPTKREGWQNMYRDTEVRVYCGDVYGTEQEAKEAIDYDRG